MLKADWDTIIVGAGSAGCALAARLAADASRRVLLLEAGPRDRGVMLRIPVGNFRIIGDKRFDWCFQTEPEPHLGNRRLSWPRGKVLGGSSAINGLIAIRGHRDDYDAWSAEGCTGWSWNEVLPYFKRLEDFENGADEFHGAGGPLPLSNARNRHFLCDAYAKAAQEKLGIRPAEDFNASVQEGAGYYHVNVSRNLLPVRVSAASAYLKHAAALPNLHIATDALVHRITFEGRRATGIIFDIGGERHHVTARRQIILAAGVIGSPHILQLSGIGDPEHLRKLGIDVVHALPAVGQNLQDHYQVPLTYRVNVPTINDKVRTVFGQALRVMEGIFMGTGAYYGVTNFGIFARTDASVTRPDVQFHVHAASAALQKPDRFSGMTIAGCQLRPESRGHIRARSSDPHEAPAISANYLDTGLDRNIVVKAMRIARQLADSAALRPYIVEERKPGLPAQSDDELLDFARQEGATTYHPVGSCRMGSDDATVVDPRLRLRGMQGIYIADASIMPKLVSGNTHLPAVMIGEKASDMIREDERV